MRRLPVLAVAAVLVLLPGPAQADGPTCAEELGVDTHGQHIVGDYVMGVGHDGPWPPRHVGETIGGAGAAVRGGPGPGFHFLHGVAPGASFCNEGAMSPGLHL